MSRESHHTVAVTGINGFVGKHLTRELASHDITVIGVGQEDQVHDEISDLVKKYYQADLTKEWPVEDKIDAVIHLAGLAAVGPSFDRPQDYINLNSAMISKMGEYYREVGVPGPRVVIVSSGAVYSPDQAMPQTEDSVFGVSSPYVVSKLLVELQCEYYCNLGLDFVVARPFNHIGPGQLGGFLVPDVIGQLLEDKDEILVGNINTKRDYTDVRDVVAAYRQLATAVDLNHRTYNVCSGRSVAGKDIIDAIKKILGKESVEVTVDKSLVRPTDPADVVGDSSRLQADTGWSPKIPLEQTLKDCVGGI
jgi:GDP-4-dehydro-6-deoxy-D-mannose reductase